jgi:hypothetical protein
LDLAANLKDVRNEASWRTSVSRSYYALFNLTAQFINKNIVALSNSAEDHKKVYRYLDHCGVENVQTIARSLNSLRVNRNDADYKLDSDRFDENCANMAFIQAKIAMEGFEGTIRNTKGRQALIDGINSYKKLTNY